MHPGSLPSPEPPRCPSCARCRCAHQVGWIAPLWLEGLGTKTPTTALREPQIPAVTGQNTGVMQLHCGIKSFGLLLLFGLQSPNLTASHSKLFDVAFHLTLHLVSVIKGKLKKRKKEKNFLAWTSEHHDCFINTARGYEIVMSLKAAGGRKHLRVIETWCTCDSAVRTTRPTSSLHSGMSGLCSSRAGENDNSSDRKNSESSTSKWRSLGRVLPLGFIFFFFFLLIGRCFVFFHLATCTLMLIAPQEGLRSTTVTFYSLDESVLTWTWHLSRSGPRGIALSARSPHCIFM